jgi:hypothetical protein
VTFFYAVIDREQLILHFENAGHGAGSVRDRLRSRALLPFEPIFAGIRTWPWR